MAGRLAVNQLRKRVASSILANGNSSTGARGKENMNKRLWKSYKELAIRLHDDVHRMPSGEEFSEPREMLEEAALRFERILDSIGPTED